MSTKSNADSVECTDGVEYMLELADTEGVACATVTDGHVLIFTKNHLEALLKTVNDSGNDKCILFIKRQKFDN